MSSLRLHHLQALIRLARRLVSLIFLISLMLVLLQYSTVPLGLQWNAVSTIVSPYQFDYVTWELNALAAKVDETLFGLHPFMNETNRTQFVRDYMDELRQVQTLEAQIALLFADTTVADPAAAATDLHAQRDHLRAGLAQKQPIVEAILEGQVAAVLVDQNFGLLGQLLPPISAHFTQVPNLLVVSPRSEIRFDISINLNPMTVDEMAALENRIDTAQNVSSLVVSLGGIALYPSMVLETASIPDALDTIAHEWLHHYLFAFPLGLQYFNGDSFVGETRIINETTASLFGHEISRLVLARYYPDLLPPEVPPSPPPTSPVSPPVFDFGRAMDETRRHVDDLLGAGKVAEAESYMEERRRLFVENGYLIRKLNQAYFAFYGGYQAGGTPGIGGADPIGPAIAAIRDASPSIHEWIVTMRGITTREELLSAQVTIERGG
jgi:hypothetical protein